MKLGMVGLGRMGANMTRRLMRGGHEIVVTDLSADNVKHIAGEGAIASASIDDFATTSRTFASFNGPSAAGLSVGCPMRQLSIVQRRDARLRRSTTDYFRKSAIVPSTRRPWTNAKNSECSESVTVEELPRQ